jgi:hypothetical protein
MAVDYAAMQDRRRVRLALAALTVAALVLAGDHDLALTLAPALLIGALPLFGRFPGEALIVARRAARVARPRPARVTWPRTRAGACLSLLQRSVQTLRGPPVVA